MQTIIPLNLVYCLIVFIILLVVCLLSSFSNLKKKEQAKLQIIINKIQQEKKIETSLKLKTKTIESIEKSIYFKLRILKIYLLNIQFSLTEILN